MQDVTVDAPGKPYRPRLFTVAGTGAGESGHRSRAVTQDGRRIGAERPGVRTGSIHLTETIRAAAPHQRNRERDGRRIAFRGDDLRVAVREGHESNLVLFCVDASGSMAATQRMEQVKTAILSLLLDAYQRRDKVGLITFRAGEATLALPPTSSVDIAAARLDELPAGGRTPLAEGLLKAAETLRLEHVRDPRRRPLLVVVTDGRATHGADAARSRRTRWPPTWPTPASPAVVIDCETGRFRMGLAHQLADHLMAEYVPLGEVSAVRPDRRREGRGLMPKGQPLSVPDDGLTTRQRRNRPLLMVHTGDGKGKSTAAFGLALRGVEPGLGHRRLPVREVGQVAHRRADRPGAPRRAARRDRRRRSDRVEQDGLGLVVVAQGGLGRRPRRRRRRGLAGDQATPRRRAARPLRARRVHLPDERGAGSTSTTSSRPSPSGPGTSTSSSPDATPTRKLVEIADLVTEMQHVKHPFDHGQKGQKGIEW